MWNLQWRRYAGLYAWKPSYPRFGVFLRVWFAACFIAAAIHLIATYKASPLLSALDHWKAFGFGMLASTVIYGMAELVFSLIQKRELSKR